jgi:hypothetical protein
VNTLSCLLIKHAILVSQEKDRQTAVRLVADTLKEVSVKFGTKGQRAKPADSALKTTRSSLVTYTVPQNIEQLPLVLYHLAKGPLLGDLVASYDDRVVEGALVLRSGVEACVRLALPTLLSFNSAGDLKQLPLITLSLDSNRILFMDCHSHILVWSGLNVTHGSYDVFRDVCLSRALVSSQSRLPQPIVLCFNEGDSNARWLSSRLSPAHQDPSYLHPSLQGLSIQAIQALCGKFTPTDQPSYHQFMATLFN